MTAYRPCLWSLFLVASLILSTACTSTEVASSLPEDGDMDTEPVDGDGETDFYPDGDGGLPDGDEPIDGDEDQVEDGDVDADLIDGDMDAETDGDEDQEIVPPECTADSSCCNSAGQFRVAGTPCNDDDACTDADQCDGAGTCSGTIYSCNDHGICNESETGCTCDTGYSGEFCDQCALETLGTYPNCFLPSAAFCATSQCFPVTPTMQTTCYDDEVQLSCPDEVGAESCGTVDYCGQDAQYDDIPRTYTCYAANGEIADCATLIPLADNQLVVDGVTALMWQRSVAAPRSWDAAKTYCEQLTCGGYEDWRLPSSLELLSIVDNGASVPAIDTAAFRGTPSANFWTVTPRPLSEGVRYVNFGTGHCSYFAATQGAYVRCVRGGFQGVEDGTIAPYVISEDEEPTVLHMVTGLIWQTSDIGNLTWKEALAYCENLTYAGHTNWRLPDVKQLQSLLNHEIVSPSSTFPDAALEYYWTSTTSRIEPTEAWAVGLGSGAVYPLPKTALKYARCVAVEAQTD